MLDAGLIDELHLLVDPIVVRDGMRLFDNGGAALPLALVSSRALSNGVIYVVYAPVQAQPKGSYREASSAMARASGDAAQSLAAAGG